MRINASAIAHTSATTAPFCDTNLTAKALLLFLVWQFRSLKRDQILQTFRPHDLPRGVKL